MPSLSSPMALSIPAAVSTVRGGAFPARGALVTVFGTMPPSFAKSTRPAHFPGVAERSGRDQNGDSEVEAGRE